MDGKILARIGAVVFAAVAVTATAIEMNRKEEGPEAWPSGRVTHTQAEPLRDELIHCQTLGEAGPRDAACLRAWAENRKRFLAPGPRPAERLPDATPAPPTDRANQPALDPAAPITPPHLDEAR